MICPLNDGKIVKTMLLGSKSKVLPASNVSQSKSAVNSMQNLTLLVNGKAKTAIPQSSQFPLVDCRSKVHNVHYKTEHCF